LEPNTFNFKCPACGASLLIPIEHQGKQGQCNKCGTTITARAQRRISRPVVIACGIGAILAISTFSFAALQWSRSLQSDPEHGASELQQAADAAVAIDSNVAVLPDYVVVKTEVEDAPNGGLVRRYIVITGGKVTRESLIKLLVHEGLIASQIRGPKYQELPSKYAVRVYSSRAHWESENQRAVAWVFRNGSGEVSSEIDEVLIAEYDAVPTTKFGLTEEQRKAIWNDGCYGERAATKAAEQAFPWPASDDDDPNAWKNFYENTRPKQSEMKDRLRRENDQTVIN